MKLHRQKLLASTSAALSFARGWPECHAVLQDSHTAAQVARLTFVYVYLLHAVGPAAALQLHYTIRCMYDASLVSEVVAICRSPPSLSSATILLCILLLVVPGQHTGRSHGTG